ncbi:MAG: hypothetical protein ACYCXW_00560 [Solirubrobacteraceae bacterium]
MLPNAGGLVYGTMLVATLLSAESAARETYAKTVAAVGVTLIAYWLTISYAEYAGERLERGKPLELGALVRAAVHELWLLVGAALPLTALLVLWAAGVALSPAVTVAVWVAIAAIVAAEAVSGVRAELTGRELAGQIVVGGLLGGLVLAIRVLLH